MKILNKIKFVLILIVLWIPAVVLTYTFFTTPPYVFAIATALDLGSAEDFAVLAGAAVSDANPIGTITGDVGLSPTGGASITGLSCSQVTGSIYDTDGGYTGGFDADTGCLVTNPGLLTTAKSDLSLAYNDANGQTPDTLIDDGDIGGGETLTPGVYSEDSTPDSLAVTGNLTLDGGGDANAVFIFQSDSTLVTSAGSQITLTNGAQACNVYWQVGSSATLGVGSSFVGTIMAAVSITDNGGSTVQGRLLADADNTDADSTGAVSLNNTTIEVPTCAAATPTPAPTSTTTTSVGAPIGSYCPPLSSQIVAPTIIDSRRVDADSIYISWAPYSGTDQFNVEYGTENGKWLYNVDVTGFSTTINALPLNQPIWVRVAARSDCTIGTYGESRLVGGPGLPSTGFAPGRSNISWFILAGFSLFSTILLKRTHA